MGDPYESYKPVKLHHICVSKKNTRKESPIILIHGYYGTYTTWNRIINKLSTITKRTVYAIDLRNHGESEYSEEFSTKHLAADVLQFMKEQNIPLATLIAHSVGGRVAMEIALHKPELVETLIIEDMSISDKDQETIKSFGTFALQIYRTISTLPATMTVDEAYEKLSPITDKYLPQFSRNGGKSDMEKALPFYKDEETGEFKFCCNMEVLIKHVFEPSAMRIDLNRNPTYTGRTLFIKGEYTIIPIDEDRSLIRKHFPNSKFVTIKGGYHVIHTENTTDFLQVVTNFLKSHEK